MRCWQGSSHIDNHPVVQMVVVMVVAAVVVVVVVVVVVGVLNDALVTSSHD